jgi:tetratricopeptide (TPR) repeat protein
MTRRYAQAAEFARQAIALAPRLWRAHLSLGVALLRLGQIEAGRAEIEIAFQGDPFNVWAKNTLDLLDSMRDYPEVQQGNFIIKTAAPESPVLGSYAGALLAEAASTLNAKYKFTPQGPIRVEIFPNHEDFAVRALGLPGLGALGVCFGQVIALDSPSARPAGEFNWGSTLWHEYTHVLTLQMTEHRIPRWFSEGLSVYEERRGRPGWGEDWNPTILRAFAANHWFSISNLDAGFQRPQSPLDVPLAYFQAGQICEFIVERFGFEAILRMLSAYRDRNRTEGVIQQVLKLSPAEFDRAFAEYLTQKVAPLLQGIGPATDFATLAQLPKEEVLRRLEAHEDFALHLRAGDLFRAEGQTSQAVTHWRRALELFPFFTGPGNAYEQLAQLYVEQGNKAGAAAVLEEFIKHDDSKLAALRELVSLYLALDKRDRALALLQLAFYVNPFDELAHAQAGDLYLARNEATQALNEFQMALALRPTNVAEAHYNLARAYWAAGNVPAARRAVLHSLEAAPEYEKAQELLLKISEQ